MVTPELVNYIRAELGKGKTRTELEKDLFMQGGWKTTDVAEAFRTIDGVAMPQYKKSRLHRGRGWVILILLLVGGYTGWWIRDRQQFFTILRFPTSETPIQQQTMSDQNEANKSTYTYTNQGFSIELPKEYIPRQSDETDGADAGYFLFNGVYLNYTSRALWWEKNKLTQYAYIRDRNINGKVFKMYSWDNGNHYWLKSGEEGYDFSVSDEKRNEFEEILKTFKFTSSN